jgi:chromosome partitioning protein
MAIKIGVFNHKGGVAKTTTSFHLGWMLTNLGYKVLFVDSDSQCNLSTLFLGNDEFEDHYIENPLDNLKNSLAPAFESKPQLLQAPNCLVHKKNERLFLLPGNPEITEYETQLGIAINFNQSFTVAKNLPGSFNYLINITAEKYEVDYVIIDMNPSLSAINQVLLMSTDYFILPLSIDYFSERAVDSMSKIIPRWSKWYNEAIKFFNDSEYKLPEKKPKFLGYIFNNFNKRKDRPSKPVQSIMDSITAGFDNQFIPRLKEEGMINENQKEFKLAQISDFQSLKATYQESSLPIFEITTEHGYSGALVNQYENTIADFKEVYKDLTVKIIKLIEGDE